MKLVYPSDQTQNERIAKWVMEKLGRRAVMPYRALGVIDHAGELVAGVVFNGYNGANVDITIYAPRLVTADATRRIFTYAFSPDILNCTRITARCRRSATTAIGGTQMNGAGGFMQRLGFVQEGFAIQYYGRGKDGDAVVYRMLKSECRWIGGRHGRRTRGARSEKNRGGASRDESRNGHHADRS